VAIFGIVGAADMAELRDMGRRLSHCGNVTSIWSPDRDVWFGRTATSDTGVKGRLLFEGTQPCPEELAADPGRTLDGEVLADLHSFWTLAFWDETERALVLAADHFRVKSLCYAILPDRVAFASELKAIYALQDFAPTLDPEAIQHYHALRHVRFGEVFFKDVHMIPAASLVKIKGFRAEARRYWSLPPVTAGTSMPDQLADLRAQLLDSMRRQCAGLQRLGVAASGGLDSAIVVVLSAPAAPHLELAAFTIGYGERDPEVRGAREMAEAMDVPHEVVWFDLPSLPGRLADLVWRTENCGSREESLLAMDLADQVRGKVPALAYGDAADALFGGMPRHRIQYLAERVPVLRGPLMEFFQFTQSGHPPAGHLGRLLGWLAYRGRTFPPPRVQGTDGPALVELPADLHTLNPAGVLQASYLRYREAASAWSHVGYVAPFLDKDIAASVARLPPRAVMTLFRPKRLLREACAGLVPDAILQRTKTLNRLPHDEFLAEILDDLASELLSVESVQARGLIDPDYVRQVRTKRRGSQFPTDQMYRLWTLLSVEIWMRQFVDRRGCYWAPGLPESTSSTIS
jgi:asparagine synthase (glutamine-hydrolysing)